ncbi:TIGR01777 family oxidoreductase [Caulifigura coniformis]|nr:TIGR01777 family oxidoreductase [Caulifigura coniformis]
MNVLISGSSGLVGRHLMRLLRASGHGVTRLVRREPTSADERFWDPAAGKLDPSVLEGVHAVVNLAGDNIGKGRWNDAKKKRILESRVQTAGLLADTIARSSGKPNVFVTASAIGIYGNRGSEALSESSAAGEGFLVDVCRQWEAAAMKADVRTVLLRFGMILTPEDGALAAMLTPFKLGVGGNMGDGKQYWSWVTLDDAVRVILFALTHAELSGPVNAVAPQPVTNAEFTRALGSVLHRPTFLPMPAFAARLALGEMADSLILSSTRVVPTRLQSAGYEYMHPDLKGALTALLKG